MGRKINKYAAIGYLEDMRVAVTHYFVPPAIPKWYKEVIRRRVNQQMLYLGNEIWNS